MQWCLLSITLSSSLMASNYCYQDLIKMKKSGGWSERFSQDEQKNQQTEHSVWEGSITVISYLFTYPHIIAISKKMVYSRWPDMVYLSQYSSINFIDRIVRDLQRCKKHLTQKISAKMRKLCHVLNHDKNAQITNKTSIISCLPW